jgi:LEA14-like dessication related protein
MNRSLRTLLSVLAVVVFSSCANMTQGLLKDPEVSILDFKLSGITSEDVSMDLQLNVKNPNPIPLALDEVTYSLNFSGEKVTEGTFNKGVNIPAIGEGKVTIPLKFKFNSVGNLLSGFINRKFTKEYELSGAAKVGLFSIPFIKKGEVNLAK